MAKEDANPKESKDLKTIDAPKDAGPKLETFIKKVPGRRGHEDEEAEFVTLDLVADRSGGRRRPDGAGPAHQERPVSRALGHEERGQQGLRGRQ